MMKFFPFLTPALNLVESLVDSCRDNVKPKVGSVVYCDMYCGYAEHSGIYVGNNRIIHLNGDGVVEEVSPYGFTEDTTAINIYISSRGENACGSEYVADNAYSMLGNACEYNMLLNNCHQFTAYCLNGDIQNSCSFLWMLKDEAEKHINADTWRHWDR